MVEKEKMIIKLFMWKDHIIFKLLLLLVVVVAVVVVVVLYIHLKTTLAGIVKLFKG